MAEELSRAWSAEKLGSDQWSRWSQGEQVFVESYLRQYPSLQADTECVLQLINNEVVIRQQLEGPPRLKEYLGRFPQLRPQLERMFEVHWALEGIAPPAPGWPGRPPAPLGGGTVVSGGRWPAVPGYQILGEIGRGGMGVVYRARQLDLDRLVALKMIRGGPLAGRGPVERFGEEALAVARLRHANIVQIYEVGKLEDSDGSPFLALEFIDGGSLAQKVNGTPLPARQAAELVRTLAGAVQHAHEQGVIHRDLKPANVLLAADGTPKVTDFGLAKRLDGSAGLTGSSDLLGTPSYMAPEQARGQARAVGPQADVYSLGAVFYETLTGRAPFTAPTPLEILSLVQTQDPVPVRRLQERVPRDLETICLKCLRKEPEKRYGSAQELADDLGRFLAGESIRARPVSPFERALKWARRNPWRTTLASAFIALLIAGAVFGWWRSQQRERDDRMVDRMVGEAELLKEQAWDHPHTEGGKFDDALARGRDALELARSGWASDGMRQRAADLVRELEEVSDAARRDRRLVADLLEVVGTRELPQYRRGDTTLLESPGPTIDGRFRAAFRTWDPTFDADTLPTQEAAARFKRCPPAVVEEVVAGLDAWAEELRQKGQPRERWQRLTDLAQALDTPDPKRRELRAILARNNLKLERALGGLALALRPVPIPFDAGLGKDRSRLRQLAEEVDVAREPPLSLLTLARALQAAGDEDPAARLLWQATQARPQQVLLRVELGMLYARARPPRWSHAADCFSAARVLRPGLGLSYAGILVSVRRTEEGFALYELLTKQNPDNPWPYLVWQDALRKWGRPRKAEEVLQTLLRRHPGLLEVHLELGDLLMEQNRLPEAVAAYEHALRIKPNRAGTYLNLGNALAGQDKLPEAIKAYQKALDRDPNFSKAHYSLGRALWRQGQVPQAVTEINTAARLQPDLVEPYLLLGHICFEQGAPKEAEKQYRDAVRVQPTSPEAHNGLGRALLEQGKYPQAEAEFREALHLRPSFPEAQANLGYALHGQERLQEAELAYRRALRLRPDWAEVYSNLGNTLAGQNKLEEGAACFRTALRLRPKFPEGHFNLGLVLLKQKKVDEAIRAFKEALRLKPDFHQAWNYLNLTLAQQKQAKKSNSNSGGQD